MAGRVNNLILESSLNALLNVESFSDYAPNGLQIEGKSEISKVAFAVSATMNIIQKAEQEKCDALFVHHGLFWNKVQPLRGALGRKAAKFFTTGMNLFAYHLPLDAHDILGNNAGFLKDFGSEQIQPFGDIGFSGSLPSPLSINEYTEKLDAFFAKRGLHIYSAEKKENLIIQKIAIVSGAGQSYLEKAALDEMDAFISGEASEQSYSTALENNIVFSAVGHNKSEETGVKKMKEYFESKLNLETIFFAEENPF